MTGQWEGRVTARNARKVTGICGSSTQPLGQERSMTFNGPPIAITEWQQLAGLFSPRTKS